MTTTGLPYGYEVYESDQRVPNLPPDMTTRWRARAERRRDMLDEKRLLPSYRYEVVEENGRYLVVAFQNYARPQS